MLYSVPYAYIGKKVDVRVTESMIEVFYKQDRIASHRRLKGRPGQYSTVPEHMPPDHQKYLEWDGDRFRKWAIKIGSNTKRTIDCVLRRRADTGAFASGHSAAATDSGLISHFPFNHYDIVFRYALEQ